MAQVSAQLSTGLPGFDRVLKGLIPGDNIVWQVGSIDDYVPFIEPHDLPGACALVLNADALKQEVLCYLERQDE